MPDGNRPGRTGVLADPVPEHAPPGVLGYLVARVSPGRSEGVTHTTLMPLDEAQREATSRGLGWAPVEVREMNRMPTVPQIHAWLRAHGWALRSTGEAGTSWNPLREEWAWIGVPGDDKDDLLTNGAIARIAAREGRPADEVRREMAAIEVREVTGG